MDMQSKANHDHYDNHYNHYKNHFKNEPILLLISHTNNEKFTFQCILKILNRIIFDVVLSDFFLKLKNWKKLFEYKKNNKKATCLLTNTSQSVSQNLMLQKSEFCQKKWLQKLVVAASLIYGNRAGLELICFMAFLRQLLQPNFST